MKTLIVMIIGAIGGAFATAMVYSNHVVQTNSQWLIVPRAGVNVKDVYADVRDWSLEDWNRHRELTRDMINAGHAEIIKTGSIDRAVDEAYDRLTQRPEGKRASAPVWDAEETVPADNSADDFQPESNPE